MEDRFNRLEEKLDGINERLGNIDQTLVRQEKNLELHMYRTDLNEKAVAKMSTALEPLQRHVGHIEGGLKLLGIISLVSAFIFGLFKFLESWPLI